jgi:hypothetical protein
MNKKLIFVYNANSGRINGLIDFAHKNISPNTYKCNLCAITYGNLGMRKEWKNFLEGLEYEVEFLHKDELKDNYPFLVTTKLPVLFIQSGNESKLLIDSKSMNRCTSIEDLKKQILNKINTL